MVEKRLPTHDLTLFYLYVQFVTFGADPFSEFTSHPTTPAFFSSTLTSFWPYDRLPDYRHG